MFRVLIKQKSDSHSQIDRRVVGEMAKLKLVELRRSDSLDQSEADFSEIELGSVELPLDIDLETNRTRIESYLKQSYKNTTSRKLYTKNLHIFCKLFVYFS